MQQNWKVWIKNKTRNSLLANFFGVKERNSTNIYHILKRAPAFPTLLSAETNSTGTIITMTFNKNMIDPESKKSQFNIKV